LVFFFWGVFFIFYVLKTKLDRGGGGVSFVYWDKVKPARAIIDFVVFICIPIQFVLGGILSIFFSIGVDFFDALTPKNIY